VRVEQRRQPLDEAFTDHNRRRTRSGVDVDADGFLKSGSSHLEEDCGSVAPQSN
jgi:hypothetical protein